MTTASPPPFTLPSLPKIFHNLISPFPLLTYPPVTVPNKRTVTAPTLWIVPPLSTTPDTKPDFLSADVECLKWQAHLALRGVHAQVRWDVDAAGALGGRLPCLQVPSEVAKDKDGELLAAHNIPGWIVENAGEQLGELEGYTNEEARDESRAWIALLEGDVHAALALSQPAPSFVLHTLLQVPFAHEPQSAEKILSPPPAPLSGLLSLVQPLGKRLAVGGVHARYHEAVAALSERLGTDRWFLGSAEPTALDALAFAYLHTLLNSTDELRIEVARRVNLVSWERRVYEQVRSSFESSGSS
ncbi:hypothetical protein PENSPDRAFT_578320 [Peniophora sp. CONT]|nr:hypothetical protein PENSPDRAFT_578320 [Peniophora sp. CONT]